MKKSANFRKMKIYIAYKFRGRKIKEVKNNLSYIAKIIEDLGHESFIFIRDIQKWKKNKNSNNKIMELAIINMKKCDIILSIIDEYGGGEGMLIENGFMKALNKKIIVASKINKGIELLKAISDYYFEFKDLKEFRKELREIIKTI